METAGGSNQEGHARRQVEYLAQLVEHCGRQTVEALLSSWRRRAMMCMQAVVLEKTHSWNACVFDWLDMSDLMATQCLMMDYRLDDKSSCILLGLCLMISDVNNKATRYTYRGHDHGPDWETFSSGLNISGHHQIDGAA